MALTWHQKRDRPSEAKLTRLGKPFAGVPAGALLYVSTPREIDAIVRACPSGATMEVVDLRDRLAHANGADATCPVTTSMFLRIVAEAALEELAQGAGLDEVAPFWRVVDPDGPVAGRLSCGRRFVRDRRADEAAV